MQAAEECREILPDPSGPFVKASYDDKGMLYFAEVLSNDKTAVLH